MIKKAVNGLISLHPDFHRKIVTGLRIVYYEIFIGIKKLINLLNFFYPFFNSNYVKITVI